MKAVKAMKAMKASATYTATIDGEETAPFNVAPHHQKQLRIPPMNHVLIFRSSRPLPRQRRVYALSATVPLNTATYQCIKPTHNTGHTTPDTASNEFA